MNAFISTVRFALLLVWPSEGSLWCRLRRGWRLVAFVLVATEEADKAEAETRER